NTLKQDVDGVDVKHDISIKEDLALGIGVNLSETSRGLQLNPNGLTVNLAELQGLKMLPTGVGVAVDGVTVQIGADGILNGNYQVMYPLQRAGNEISLQYDELTMKTGPAGLSVTLSETDRGLQQLADGLGVRTQVMDPIKSGFDGIYLQLSPDDSCLTKTSGGLEVAVAPDGPLRKEILGLDIAVDNVTVKKSLVGFHGGYVGDEDGDIVVQENIIRSITSYNAPLVKTGNVVSLNLVAQAPDLTYANGVLSCNISAGRGLVKTGSILSLAQSELDKLDEIPEDITEKMKTLDYLSSVVDDALDIGKQIGISIGTSALTSAVTSAVSAASMGIAAQTAAQNIISSNAAKAIGAAGFFSGLFGLAGGLLGGHLGKKGSGNTYISYNSILKGMIKEKDTNNEADSYLYGFSITT
ncbi:hypothetical protein HDV00_001084, partial [Rhizophlyctis rosea]